MGRDRLRKSTLCLLSEAAGPSVALEADALSGSYPFGLYNRVTTCCYSATVLRQHIREHMALHVRILGATMLSSLIQCRAGECYFAVTR
jgi:hypothetical protein